MYEIFLRMYLGFQSPFQSRERPSITSQRSLKEMGNKIGVLVDQELDVLNFFKDVPNFVKDVPNFVNDVPRVRKSIPRLGTISNHFLRVSKGINEP